MRRLVPALLIAALAAAVFYFHSESLRRGARIAKLAPELSATRKDAVELRRALAAARSESTDAKARVSRLEGELKTEIDRRGDVAAWIERTAQALRAERERHNKEIWSAKKFMPEGVRQALVAANECLRADGQTGLRFLKATKIEDHVLHGVQLLDQDASTLISRLYAADRVTFELDRAKGTMTLRFLGGFRRGPTGRYAFPAEGEPLLLTDVDGRNWEERLPYLVKVEGEYPQPVAEARVTHMEPTLQANWRKRVNDLLAKASTGTRYRLDVFRDLDGGRFRDALLLGYDKGKKLSMSVEAKQLWVQVDEKSGVVEVRIADGILRKPGGETTIPKSGYRIRLTGVKPAQALDLMLGMVIRQ